MTFNKRRRWLSELVEWVCAALILLVALFIGFLLGMGIEQPSFEDSKSSLCYERWGDMHFYIDGVGCMVKVDGYMIPEENVTYVLP